jgi:hypothetical protein
MNNPTEEEIRAFVGPRADYYLKNWRRAVDGPGKDTGFNWSALFFTVMWLPYRKMYRVAGIFLGVILLETILEEVIYVGILGRPEAPVGPGHVLGLVACIVCGGYANDWYLSHARKIIAEIRDQGLPEDAYFEALARRGRTSLLASSSFMVIFFLAGVVTLSLLEFFLARV